MEQPGTMIEGKYEILGKIREGGMGTIYKVRHRLLDEIRVIKVIRPQAQADAEAKRRFTQEARTATRLKHPNIATIYDFALDEDGTAYLVMEFIEGVSLSDLLSSRGSPELPLVLEIAHQTLSALGYLHRKNVVHRDVAPDNLMLTQDEEGRPRVKLIDLGIAKALDRPGDLTSTGMFLGKLKYASPEQYGALPRGEKLDGRSDIYGFGVVLYELLTGSRPFEGETPAELLKAHVSEPPLPFAESDPKERIPPELRASVLKALEKKREDRFPTAEEFDRALAPLRSRFPLVADLGPTLVIPAGLRATPTPADSSITPGAQDRLNRQFAGKTPAFSPSPAIVEGAVVERDTPRPKRPGRSVSVAVLVVAALGAVAVAALLVVRQWGSRPATAMRPIVNAVATVPPQTIEPTQVARALAPTPGAIVSTTAAAAPSPEPVTTSAGLEAAAEATPRPSSVPLKTPIPAAEEIRRVHAAYDARDRSAQARARAEAAGARQFAAALYEGGRTQEKESQRLLARGNFSGARAAFDLAARQFERAEEVAQAAPRPTPQPDRDAAEEARLRCSRSRAAAEAVDAQTRAALHYGQGRRGQRQAETLFTRGDFSAAREAFGRASRYFEKATLLASETSRRESTPVPTRPSGGRRATLEESQIRETIRLGVKAQSALDAKLYTRVYPSLDRRRLEQAFASLKSQSLRTRILSIQVLPDGRHAEARIYEERIVVPKRGPEHRSDGERVLSFEKRGTDWVITRISRANPEK